MKRCPTCKKTFAEQYLTFCIEDGTPLVPVDEPVDVPGASHADEQTVVSPSGHQRPDGPAGGYVPPGGLPSGGKRRVWPWVVAILAIVLLVLAGLGIAAATFIPSILNAANENAANRNMNSGVPNANENSNSDLADNNNSLAEVENANNSDVGDETPPPTNESDVLVVLTDLEHEWTVANINADKKKLNRILADDYVGTTTDGRTQGKADYLKTIQRDTSIQKWAFEELKVSLQGDRASLRGLLKLDVVNQQGAIVPVAFRFTDKFVWRDNRWQAVSSEVVPAAAE